MSFVRAANPIWYLPDLVGQPLNDEYFAFFLTNTLPYLPQNVYMDNQGQTVWTGDIVQFFPNGTLPNNLFFDPNLVYRIEVRHGNSQSDALIYEVNDFVPEAGESIITQFSIFEEDNQASNPQFALVNFTRPPGGSTVTTTITAAGSYLIAPDWFLDLAGSGSAVVQQIIYSADQNTVSPLNPVPPYALRVNVSGSWSTVTLRQRFKGNGGIYVNGAISMSVLALSEDTPHTITLTYRPQAPGVPLQVKQGVIGTGAFTTLAGVINVGSSVNNNLSNVSYVDMEINLPTSGVMQFSNFQVVGQNASLPSPGAVTPPAFKPESQERNIDHLFNYFADQLILKPKKSLLVGWNFPLNPYQFITTALTSVANMTQYIADQTILHQEAANQIQTGKNVDVQRNDLVCQAVLSATDTKFALIQYIDPATIRPYWSYRLSCLVRARIFTNVGSQVGLKVRLIWRTTLPSAISNTEPISAWSGTDPTFSAGWTAIAPLNDPEYILENNYSDAESVGGTAYPLYAFNEFQLPNMSTQTMTLGIVVYTGNDLNSSVGNQDLVSFDKISLIPSDFAADALPQTFDECLRECQYYYEMSYNIGVLPGAITDVGERMADNSKSTDSGSGNLVAYPTEFTFPWAVVKRANPVVKMYSPSAGTINRVDSWLYNNGSPVSSPTVVNFVTNWLSQVPAQKSFESGEGQNSTLQTDSNPPTNKTSTYIVFHYTADARLGV